MGYEGFDCIATRSVIQYPIYSMIERFISTLPDFLLEKKDFQGPDLELLRHSKPEIAAPQFDSV
jgi:hypothetical protein